MEDSKAVTEISSVTQKHHVFIVRGFNKGKTCFYQTKEEKDKSVQIRPQIRLVMLVSSVHHNFTSTANKHTQEAPS